MIYDVNVNADYTADRGFRFFSFEIVQFSKLAFVVGSSIGPMLSSFGEHGQTVRPFNKGQKHKK